MKRSIKSPRTVAAVVAPVALATLLTGCSSSAGGGSLLGAGLGAVLGQAIGRDTEGTLIGTGIGAAVGYGIGNEIDKGRTRPEPRYEYDRRYDDDRYDRRDYGRSHETVEYRYYYYTYPHGHRHHHHDHHCDW